MSLEYTPEHKYLGNTFDEFMTFEDGIKISAGSESYSLDLKRNGWKKENQAYEPVV